jgi:hypothetical protein
VPDSLDSPMKKRPLFPIKPVCDALRSRFLLTVHRQNIGPNLLFAGVGVCRAGEQ